MVSYKEWVEGSLRSPKLERSRKMHILISEEFESDKIIRKLKGGSACSQNSQGVRLS